MKVIGIALCALVGVTNVSAQEGADCDAQLIAFGQSIPQLPGAPVWADVVVTPQQSDDSADCESACEFGWDVAVDIFYDPLPMPPNPDTVLVCAAGGGSFFCSAATITQQPGGPPFVYSYDYSASDFQVDCNKKLELTLEWNAGLGYITLVTIQMSCGSCSPL